MIAVKKFHFPRILLFALFVVAGCQYVGTNSSESVPTITTQDIIVTNQEGISFEVSGDAVVAVPPGKTSYQPFGDLYEISVIKSELEGGSPAEFHLYLDPELAANTYIDEIEECPRVLTDFSGSFCYTIFLTDFEPGPSVASRFQLQSTGTVLDGTLDMTLEKVPHSVDVRLVLDHVTLQQ